MVSRERMFAMVYVALLLLTIGVRLYSERPFPDNEPYPAFLYPSFALAKNPDGEFRMPVQTIVLLHDNGDTTELDKSLLFDPKAFNSALVAIVDRMIDNVNAAKETDPKGYEAFSRWIAGRIATSHDMESANVVVIFSEYVPYWKNGTVVGQRTRLKWTEIEVP